MMQTGIAVLSIILQLLAALLALRLIRLTHHRWAWICITAALVLMVARRIFMLPAVDAAMDLFFSDMYGWIGLVISALMLAGLVYMRRYLDDTFAARRCLQESEQRYRTLAQNIPNSAVFLFDHNCRYTLADGPLLQQMDFPRDRFEGKELAEFSLPTGLVELFAPMQASALNGASTTMEHPYKGRTFSIQFMPLRNADETVSGGMVMASDITERMKAEKDRVAAHDFLQHTIDGVAEPVMVIGLDHQVMLMNRVVRENYGGDLALTPRQCHALSHHRNTPCDDSAHPCPLQQVRTTLMPVTVLHEHRTAHGQVRQVEIIASPLFDESGQLEGIIEAARDITERKKAEDTLRKSESIFRSFLEQSEDAIALADEHGILIQWSKGAEQLTGFSREESLGKPIWEIQLRSAPEDFKSVEHRKRIKATIQAALRGEKGAWLNRLTEAVIRRPDGTRLSVQTLAFSIQTEKGFLLGSILRDITERKQAEAELIRLRKAVEASGEVIFLTDRDGTITFVNPEFTRLYGYTAEEVQGKTTPRILKSGGMQPEDYALFWRNIRSKQVVKGELVNKTKDGRLLTIESSVNPVLDEAGDIDGFLAIQRDITEHKHAQKVLENSERRLSALIENGVDYISLMSADGRLMWESPSTSRMLGYNENEFLGQNTLDLVHPDDLNWLKQRFGELISTPGAQDRALFRLRHRDGSWRWVDAVITNLLQDANVEAIVVNYHDVTDRKQAEEEKNRLLSAIECAVDGIAITDEHDEYIYVNEAHAAIYGYSQEELVGKTWRSLVPKPPAGAKTEQDIELNIEQTLHNRQIGFAISETPALRKDGSQIPTEVRAKALWDQRGQYSGHVCNVLDITQRKQVEEARRRRTAELETLVSVSAAMRKARTRLEICEVVLQQLSALFDSDGAALALWDRSTGESIVALGHGQWKSWTGTRVPREKPGLESPMNSTETYLNNDAGGGKNTVDPMLPNSLPCIASVPLIASERSIGALWIGRQTAILPEDIQLLTAIRDIAANAIQRQTLNEDLQTQLEALRSAQARLVQSEKLAAIGRLVSGVAHELNNPLTSVVLYSQLAQQSDLDELTKANLSKVVSEARRAGKIVRSLLDFARQRSPKREVVQVNDILKLSLDLVSYELRAHNVDLDFQPSQDLPKILADPHQLQQVFVNLIQNAWQAMALAHGQGHLKVWTEIGNPNYGGPVSDDLLVVRICFKDDGPGISYDDMSRIFDPFFTTKPEGSGNGLGLSICHGIVTEHGGHIWAESPAGHGASFVIELPVAIGTAIGDSNLAKTGRLLGAFPEKLRLLVLDDEPNVAAVLAQALQRAGYQADVASNGVDGLRRLNELTYDLILCDIRMPELNGMDFYREVEMHHRSLVNKIIFITGDTVSTATRKFIEETKVRCLAKPFELSDLFNAIRPVLDQTP